VLALFAAALLVASTLLFLVQPMFAKMVLPMLGGTPAVWNTCVVFFEAALLLGYGYSHLSTARLGVKRQALLHAVLALLPLPLLPIAVARGWTPPTAGSPIPWLLALMAVSVGLPFFVVSTTAPLLQKWFSTTRHPSASDPYFLYAASNFGSIVALLAYPFLLEPWLSLRAQSTLWSFAYLALVLLVWTCAVITWRSAREPRPEPVPVSVSVSVLSPPPSWSRRLRWIALAAVPSSMMLGVTTYFSTDIAAVPLLWIIPLVLYLVTFILAFGSRSARLRTLFGRAMPVLVLALMLALAPKPSPWYLIPGHLLVFFAVAMVCHLELSATRPQISHLTEFYLWLSVGGLLGGLFNSLLAPLLFTGIAEYPIALFVACALRPRPEATAGVAAEAGDAGAEASAQRRRAWVRVALIAAWGAGAVLLAPRIDTDSPALVMVAMMAVPAALALTLAAQPRPFAAAVGALLVAGAVSGSSSALEYAERTFFGVYRVKLADGGRFRFLFHGTTVHGQQALGADSGEPLSYYHRGSPIAQVFDATEHRFAAGHVGVIGLGTGTLAVYAQPDQQWTYYEIDPVVTRIAEDRRFFTYLAASRAPYTVVSGDARLALAHPQPRPFDVLVIDAFSSDAIPVHLMTREALELYRRVLSAQGVIAFHISNRNLRLRPVFGRLARELGMVGLSQFKGVTDEEEQQGMRATEWVALAGSREALGELEGDARWQPLGDGDGAPLWTDDFSNIVRVLTFH
jgi:hypothetical protein